MDNALAIAKVLAAPILHGIAIARLAMARQVGYDARVGMTPVTLPNACEDVEGIIVGPANHPTTVAPPGQTNDSLDWDAAVARLGGRGELLQQMASLFLNDCDKHLADLRTAIAKQDTNALMRTAHLLKGSADWFAAKPVVAVAQRLETLGQNGVLTNALVILAELEREMERLKIALTIRAGA